MRKPSEPVLFCCVPLVALVSIFSFLAPSEAPEKAVEIFSSQFIKGDAANIMKTIHPDIKSGKEITQESIEAFLRRFGKGVRTLKRFQINRKLTSEDGNTKRFEATLVYDGPKLSEAYPQPAELHLTFLWVLEKGRWWLERPISVNYQISSAKAYPTSAQDELAMRYEAAINILSQLKIRDDKDVQQSGKLKPGMAISMYKELEKRYPKDRSEKGIDPKSWGVTEFLKAAGMTKGGLLISYHGDFKKVTGDKRRPMPWEMFKDYAAAAAKRAKTYENRGKPQNAELIYRRIISFGRQVLSEPGGVQFAIWGLRFQRDAGKELLKILPRSRETERKQLQAFVTHVSRRLDLIQTALQCIDDMSDYRSLKAAVVAAQSESPSNFRQWAINTLAILAYKGAPADREIIGAAGAMVFVINPAMNKTARSALENLAQKKPREVKSFIDYQKQWVQKHKVYGAVSTFTKSRSKDS